MGRRVWIIPKGEDVTEDVRLDARNNGCPEIAIGVPPVLAGKVGALPCVYEEPDPLPRPKPMDIEAELAELRARLAKLEPISVRTGVGSG